MYVLHVVQCFAAAAHAPTDNWPAEMQQEIFLAPLQNSHRDRRACASAYRCVAT